MLCMHIVCYLYHFQKYQEGWLLFIVHCCNPDRHCHSACLKQRAVVLDGDDDPTKEVCCEQ